MAGAAQGSQPERSHFVHPKAIYTSAVWFSVFYPFSFSFPLRMDPGSGAGRHRCAGKAAIDVSVALLCPAAMGELSRLKHVDQRGEPDGCRRCGGIFSLVEFDECAAIAAQFEDCRAGFYPAGQ